MSEAHNWTKSDIRNGRKESYRTILCEMISKIWEGERIRRANAKAKAEREAQVAQTYTIALQYSQTKQRAAVKNLGGKWNGSVWTVVCKQWELEKAGLTEFVATANTSTAAAPTQKISTAYPLKPWQVGYNEFDAFSGEY